MLNLEFAGLALWRLMSCCWRSGEVEDSRVHLEDMESLPTVGRMPGSQSCLPPAPASPNAIIEQDETNALFDLPFSHSFHFFIIHTLRNS